MNNDRQFLVALLKKLEGSLFYNGYRQHAVNGFFIAQRVQEIREHLGMKERKYKVPLPVQGGIVGK